MQTANNFLGPGPVALNKRLLSMDEFDSLAPDVRRAVAEAAFRWAPGPQSTAESIRRWDAALVQGSNIQRGLEEAPPGYIDARHEAKGIRHYIAPKPSHIPPARSLRKFQRGTINDI